MKVLLVHNEYGKRSGEEAVVDKMAEIFAGLGLEVARLRRSTATVRGTLWGKTRAFASGIWCPAGVRAMREALERERPDLVNVHNLYPFISPAALRECRRAGVPVVMTVHNFRLICPTGLFMRGGGPCELCLERGNEWGCVRHNCENSLLKSVGYAARNAVARLRRHYIDCVDIFACITEFQRRKLIEAGFPADRIVVIPNSVDIGSAGSPVQADTASGSPAYANAANDSPAQAGDAKQPADAEKIHAEKKTAGAETGCCGPAACAGGYVGFCGRISREKGIDLLLEAARRNPEARFRLAGAVGDPTLVDDLPANVELTGFLKGRDLEDFYEGARFVVMASRCYEGFPMAILEAAKHSRTTIAPDHGGFTEIVKPAGVLFRPGEADSLAEAVSGLWHDPERAAALGRKAAKRLHEHYATPVVARQWADVIARLTGGKSAKYPSANS